LSLAKENFEAMPLAFSDSVMRVFLIIQNGGLIKNGVKSVQILIFFLIFILKNLKDN
jgi:hypothetical protein